MQIIKTTVKKLEFGVNVFRGDFIKPYPTSDSLRLINSESDLNDVKKCIHGGLSVIIDRNKSWFEMFTFPYWSKKIEETKNGIYKQLKNWK